MNVSLPKLHITHYYHVNPKKVISKEMTASYMYLHAHLQSFLNIESKLEKVYVKSEFAPKGGKLSSFIPGQLSFHIGKLAGTNLIGMYLMSLYYNLHCVVKCEQHATQIYIISYIVFWLDSKSAQSCCASVGEFCLDIYPLLTYMLFIYNNNYIFNTFL